MSFETAEQRYQETGAYSLVAKTGTMLAGLAAGSGLLSFRWSPTDSIEKAALDRIALSLMSLGTGFAAGSGYIDAVVARAFTVADTGGGLLATTGNSAKRATAMGATGVDAIRIHTCELAVPTNATFTAGAGTLGSATYYYRVSALGANGETLASTETSLAITGPAGVNVNWNAVAGATGYRIYGRSTGAELFMAEVGAVTTWLDNGSITPSGALPTVLTAGTRTLDPNAFAAVHFAVTTATNTVHLPTATIWDSAQRGYPMIFAQNEGFVIRATVPATGIWQGVVYLDWRKVRG